MNNFLNPYTVDKSRPLDPVTLHILSVVNRVAAELELPYIVVGATARDLLLFHVFGIPVTRATADVDFAVAMDSWERFRELRAALLTSGHFREGKTEHRVYLKAASVENEIPIDLIPFGGVAEADVIHWPPDRETVMAVIGFEDAIAAAVHVQVDAGLTIPVASLAGIAVLKLSTLAMEPSGRGKGGAKRRATQATRGSLGILLRRLGFLIRVRHDA